MTPGGVLRGSSRFRPLFRAKNQHSRKSDVPNRQSVVFLRADCTSLREGVPSRPVAFCGGHRGFRFFSAQKINTHAKVTFAIAKVSCFFRPDCTLLRERAEIALLTRGSANFGRSHHLFTALLKRGVPRHERERQLRPAGPIIYGMSKSRVVQSARGSVKFARS